MNAVDHTTLQSELKFIAANVDWGCCSIGTTKVPNLDENVASVFIQLSKEESEEAASAVPASEVSGGRYQTVMAKFTHDVSNTPPLEGWTTAS